MTEAKYFTKTPEWNYFNSESITVGQFTENHTTIIDGEMLIPKVIARVTLCGGIIIEINDTMTFIKPTPEQIKNLKETFCIDVELLD